MILLVDVMMDYYLNEILKLAADNNIKVYYIITPFNKASYQNLKPNYINCYNNYFSGLKGMYDKVVWQDEIFYYDNEYFGDPSHLNLLGQIKFSEYLRYEVLKKDIINQYN